MAKDRLTHYLRAFSPKAKHMSDEEMEKYDLWFMNSVEPWLENIAKSEGLNESETRRFIDLMYKVILAKGGIDERYDNVLIGEAIERARKKVRRKRSSPINFIHISKR